MFLRRQPRSRELDRAGPPPPRRRRDVELADRPAAGRLAQPRRAARRCTTSTAPSTSTCTAATASRSPATRTRRSSRAVAGAGRAAAPTSRSPPRTRSSVAEELARRFGLPLWRFANSGTEATMDAVHLMRAVTGRDLIIKVEGCYHGHHDSVQVSVLPERGRGRPARPPDRRAPATPASPQAIRDLIVVVPFNDLDAVGARARRAPRPGRRHDPRAGDDERRHHPAATDGYLAGLRDLLHRHGALLTFDEVKTGFTTGARRRHRALRRRPRHRLPGQGARRRHPGRRDRRHRRGHGGDRRRPLRAGRHVQRQPAGHGGRPGPR